jgi:pimeloyl-ACP methyl ester carboxylesterase
MATGTHHKAVTLHPVDSSYSERGATLSGDLTITDDARGLVVFVHGSGSGRHSPRNRMVAEMLNDGDLATLLFDLLTPEEETVDLQTAELRFDIEFLAKRVAAVTDSLLDGADTRHLPICYFGASTGAAAALVAAARQPAHVAAVVSRGGRPDLAGDDLPNVRAPTLLIVGGNDEPVIELNEEAMSQLRCEKQMRVVPGATHLFEEPGALDVVGRLARHWFLQHLPARAPNGGPR